MASRPKEEKYEQKLAKEALEWIASLIDEKLDCSGSRDTFHSQLKNGQRLCRLMNELKPNTIRDINEARMAFTEMENIGNFLSACEEFGVDRGDLFRISDLYKAENLDVVVLAIHALGREASRKGYQGIKPKEADA